MPLSGEAKGEGPRQDRSSKEVEEGGVFFAKQSLFFKQELVAMME
jgi:hypothetical protein